MTVPTTIADKKPIMALRNVADFLKDIFQFSEIYHRGLR
jgi:hypothetical protein